MRSFAIFAAIVASSLTACDAPYKDDGPAIDPNAPRVHITSPERGTFAGNVKTIEVKGTAEDDGIVASVLVNGVAATVQSDGTFDVVVPVTPGTNLLQAVATDEQGNAG